MTASPKKIERCIDGRRRCPAFRAFGNIILIFNAYSTTLFIIFWLASRLAGQIPVELGRLVVLKTLDISSNGLTGKYNDLPGSVYQQNPAAGCTDDGEALLPHPL